MFLLKKIPDKKFLKKLFKKNESLDPASVVGFLQFLRTSSEALITIEKFFADNGLSQGRFLALNTVRDVENGLFPYEIAECMGVSRATASGVLRGLEVVGYVRFIKSETDGRMKRVVITDSGNEKLNELTPKYYEMISSMAGLCEKKDIKQFSTYLDVIQDNINEIKLKN